MFDAVSTADLQEQLPPRSYKVLPSSHSPHITPPDLTLAMVSPATGGTLFPEEILEKIISLALLSNRSNGDRNNGSCFSMTFLLVCKTFERLAKPIIYSVLHLRSREQAEKLAYTLTKQPALCSFIRGIRVDAPSASTAFAAAAAGINTGSSSQVLDFLDVTLIDERTVGDAARCRAELETLCCALRQCPDVRLLTVRQGLYVRQQAVASFTEALAVCVRRSANLVSRYITWIRHPRPRFR